MTISFPAMERIAKMPAKFNMATKNHVTPRNSRLGTLDLNLESKKVKMAAQFKNKDTSKFKAGDSES